MTGKRLSDWVAPAAAALSVITCYGTLAAVGLLSALGVAITLNETVSASAIVVFAWLALVALWVGSAAMAPFGRSRPQPSVWR